MENIDKNTPNYLSALEDKIVELKLKLKFNESEQQAFQKEDLQLFKKFTHNLKNPLGIINSFGKMMLENEEICSSEKAKKYLEIIDNSSDFSLKLLTSFAEYTALKNGRICSERLNINLIDILQDEVKKLKPFSSERNILIDVKPEKKPIFIKTNENELRKILKALLHNAIRFSNNDSLVFIEFKINLKTVEVIITDQGIGISEDNLLKVYDAFFVCNTYAIDKVKCIGLGLSMAKIFAKNLNGNIHIKSELNKGTIAKLIFEM